MAKIQIFSVMGKNGIIFSKFMRRSLIALASGENDLEFNCFMSSRADPPAGWNNLEHILKQKHTSLNHTTGLNRSLDYIDGDFIVCSDVDIAMLIPNWDKIMINQLENNDMDIIGVDHWDNPRGYRKFPIVTFFMAKSSSHLLAQPDLRPSLVEYPNKHGQGAEVMKIKDSTDASIFGKKKGHNLLKDSGWQLPYCYKNAGLKGEVFPKSKKELQQIPQIWEIDEQVAICHKGKSSKRRQSHGFKFTKAVQAYVKKCHGIEIKR